MRLKRRWHCFAAAAAILAAPAPAPAQQQMADPDFKTTVERPAYAKDGPIVVIDEAHANFHTESGRYKPFADLLRGDGYRVTAGRAKFDRDSLFGVNVLVIANAGVPTSADSTPPAFTDTECDAVRDWVRAGGSLLLIADHAPFGSAAENLGKRFGVAMGKGWVFDRKTGEKGITTTLDFSRANGLLGRHPLLRGRDSTEAVNLVRAFTGQSLGVPKGAVALMRLSPTAREAPDQNALSDAGSATADSGVTWESAVNPHSAPVTGRAQGVAMEFGKGRVVVFGEAAMLSAQVIRYQQGDQTKEMKFGMNAPGTDDRQLALNALHWLSRLVN